MRKSLRSESGYIHIHNYLGTEDRKLSPDLNANFVKNSVKFISKSKTSSLMFCLYTIFFEKKNNDANIIDLYPDLVVSASSFQPNVKLRYTFSKKI